MIRRRSIRRLGMLLFLCVSCVIVMKVLAFDSRDGNTGGDQGEETIVGWMIDQIAAGEIELSDEDSIRQAISEGEDKFGITLSEENKVRVIGFMQKLDTIETGADDFIEQAKEMYERYGVEFVEQANDTINGAFKNALKDGTRSFFDSMISNEDE